MKITLDFLLQVIPLIISAFSVCVSAFALLANRNLSKKQAFFDRKSNVYESFWCAVAAVANDPDDQSKREKVVAEFFRASLYMPPTLAKEAEFFVEKILKANTRADVVVLDEIAPEFVEHLKKDLEKVW